MVYDLLQTERTKGGLIVTSTLVFALLLPLKHLLISNVLDFGYSRARNTRDKHWWIGFLCWVTVELFVTSYLVPKTQDWYLRHFPLWEFFLLSVATYRERSALLGRELRTHVAWEAALLTFYWTAIPMILTA